MLLKTVTCGQCGQLWLRGISPRLATVLVKRCQSVDVTARQKRQTRSQMKAWQIHQYGGNEEFHLSDTARVPSITDPRDILVEVHAASVNPIDVAMRDGYGRNLINIMRRLYGNKFGSEFPLTLGRDFSGVVVETGKGVNRFKPGDEVWGALAPYRQGSHAQYIVTGSGEISKKPKSLSHVEAASIPYVATTVWSALCLSGELSEKNTALKRVLVHGGAGGIGSFAIQLLAAWGADVTATCSTDAVEMVQSLGADMVIDYKTQNVAAELQKEEGFDLILDPIGGDTPSHSMDLLKTWRNAKYVSLVSPLLANTDELGVLGGLGKASTLLGLDLIKGYSKGRSYRWAFFIANGRALGRVRDLVDQGQIKPIIDEVFSLEGVPDAYTKVGKRHGRGKTVLEVATEQ